jgi:hypothetical protein
VFARAPRVVSSRRVLRAEGMHGKCDGAHCWQHAFRSAGTMSAALGTVPKSSGVQAMQSRCLFTPGGEHNRRASHGRAEAALSRRTNVHPTDLTLSCERLHARSGRAARQLPRRRSRGDKRTATDVTPQWYGSAEAARPPGRRQAACQLQCEVGRREHATLSC